MASKWSLSTVMLLALLMSGLASSAASANREGSASQATSRATVKVAQSKLGRILVDARGRSLYLFTSETASRIACKADFMSCTRLWPPFLTEGQASCRPGRQRPPARHRPPHKPAGLQVTYNRHPLYFYSADKKAGDTLGQAYFGLWYVVSPKGRAIKK